MCIKCFNISLSFFSAKDDPKVRGAKEDDEKRKDKTREMVEEQRHKEKEEWLKRKVDEMKAGAAPPLVQRTQSTHGAAIDQEVRFVLFANSVVNNLNTKCILSV